MFRVGQKLPGSPSRLADVDLAMAREQLYAGDPARFVAFRTQLARSARARKDRDLARVVESLRRPTRAAWLVNLLARSARDELTELFALAEQLANLHTVGTAQQIRQVSMRRWVLITTLVASAERLALARGHAPSGKTLRDVETCLQAGLAHPDAAEEILKGCLVKTPESAAAFPLELFEGVGEQAAPRPLGDLLAPLLPDQEAWPEEADPPLAPVISLAEARERHAQHAPPESPAQVTAGGDPARMSVQPSAPHQAVEEVREALAAAHTMLAELTGARDAERAREQATAEELSVAQEAVDHAAAEAKERRGLVEHLAAELARAQAEQAVVDRQLAEAQQRRDRLQQELAATGQRVVEIDEQLAEVEGATTSFEATWATLHGGG